MTISKTRTANPTEFRLLALLEANKGLTGLQVAAAHKKALPKEKLTMGSVYTALGAYGRQRVRVPRILTARAWDRLGASVSWKTLLTKSTRKSWGLRFKKQALLFRVERARA